MSALNNLINSAETQMQFRQGIEDNHLAILTDIYQDDTNMVVW
jgi:hypothetical protein